MMPNVSYQLYSSRDWDTNETFPMLAEAGFKEVEGVGPYYEDLAKTKALLDAHGMTMPTGHFALTLLEENPGKVIEIAKTLGMEAVIVPFIAPDDRPKSVAEWKAFAARLAKAGEPIVEAGLQYGWHNHDFEMIPVEGEMPLDIIAAASDDIMLELDLAWVHVGGQDPVEWLKKYSGRIVSVHVKDVAPDGENTDEDGWADVGHGVLDWKAIKPAMDAAGVTRYIVEHDKPSDHTRMATRSLASIQAF